MARYLLNDCDNSMLYYPYHKLRYSTCLSKKFTFLIRLQSLKICFRSKQFCSIIPQLTCRRWEVSWDVLSGSVLAIAARGRAGQSRRNNVRSVLQLGCGLEGTVTGSAARPTCLIWAWVPARLSRKGNGECKFYCIMNIAEQ